MRKLVFVALLASLAGCQSLGNMFGTTSRPKPQPAPYTPDPLHHTRGTWTAPVHDDYCNSPSGKRWRVSREWVTCRPCRQLANL